MQKGIIILMGFVSIKKELFIENLHLPSRGVLMVRLGLALHMSWFLNSFCSIPDYLSAMLKLTMVTKTLSEIVGKGHFSLSKHFRGDDISIRDRLELSFHALGADIDVDVFCGRFKEILENSLNHFVLLGVQRVRNYSQSKPVSSLSVFLLSNFF